MAFIRYFFYTLTLLSFLLPFVSCDRPENFEPRGPLTFTNDSIIFDTIFTTISSPTQRLYIFNSSGNNTLIENIKIATGENSEFQMTVDGRKGQSLDNFEIAKDDSIIAFFSMKAQPKEGDRNLIDQLIIKVGQTTYNITLFARVLDAYVWRDTTIDCSNFHVPTDKPIVVDGYIYVPQECTLKIPAGTQMYFTAKRNKYFDFFSQIFVKGTLIINEEGGKEVLLTSLRLEKNYKEQAGQWRGIIIADSSKGSIINRAIIKNAVYGAYVDSTSNDFSPKLTVKNSEIRNMSSYGLLGVGKGNYLANDQPSIRAYNTVISRCGQSCVATVWGGSYEFTHCTFYNDREFNFNRSQPAVGYNNYRRDENNPNIIRQVYNGKFIVQNCILWGTNDDEFAQDIAKYDGFETILNIDNNIIKTKLTAEKISGKNNILNANPLFKDIGKFDFTLKENSPGIAKGMPLIELAAPFEVRNELNLDIARNVRDQQIPDAGAYAYKKG